MCHPFRMIWFTWIKPWQHNEKNQHASVWGRTRSENVLSWHCFHRARLWSEWTWHSSWISWNTEAPSKCQVRPPEPAMSHIKSTLQGFLIVAACKTTQRFHLVNSVFQVTLKVLMCNIGNNPVHPKRQESAQFPQPAAAPSVSSHFKSNLLNGKIEIQVKLPALSSY